MDPLTHGGAVAAREAHTLEVAGSSPARATNGVRHQRERVAEVWDEMQPLLVAHWDEIAHYHDIPLNIDREGYEAVERAGALRIFTVRADGQLVGYAVFVVRRNMHYLDSLQAVQDVLFLHPAWRRANVGRELIEFADEMLRRDGVQVVYQHVKLAYDFGPLLERMGYERIETIWGRRLDL